MRILVLFLVFFAIPYISQAQFFDTSAINPGPALELQPRYPNPGDSVTISFDDYRSAAAGSELQWFYNDSLILEAQNKREVSITAPAAGKQAVVKLVLKSLSGRTETYTAVVAPVYLDIIVEPQTHVPSFYTGRALPSVGSTVTLTALLNDGAAMGTNYLYTWRLNDTVVQGGPLRNQNKISVRMPLDSNSILSLEVSTYTGAVIAQRALYLPSVTPKIEFYEINTLYGIEKQSISRGFNLIGNSASFRAEPYYLDSMTFNNPDILEWTINGESVQTGEVNPYDMTLQKTGFPGTAALGIHVRSTTQLLQGGKGSVQINI